MATYNGEFAKILNMPIYTLCTDCQEYTNTYKKAWLEKVKLCRMHYRKKENHGK